MTNKRSKKETVAYLKELAWYFEGLACSCAKKDSPRDAQYYRGKADAYEIAAFELERNMV